MGCNTVAEKVEMTQCHPKTTNYKA